jgi:sulfate adenylyltransferase large subunit
MVTAASTSDVAVLLVDAAKGLQVQTRRHAYLSHWVGIRQVVLAVNKMDLVGYAHERFAAIEREFAQFAEPLGFDEIRAIPMSALRGDMVVDRGESLGWYDGPTLLEHLEVVRAREDVREDAFRFAVQRVVRIPRGQAVDVRFADADFRGWQGTIASGSVAVGDEIVVLSSGLAARVERILVLERAVERAYAGQAVTIRLDRDIDVSRGDLLCGPGAVTALARDTRAELCWFDEEPLHPGRPYLLKLGTQTVKALLSPPDDRLDVETLARTPAGPTLAMNEIGAVRIKVQRPLPFEPYSSSRLNGAFILIEETSKRTVAAGIVG